MSIAVVIPSYKVKNHIADVIGSIGSEVQNIFVVDDCCPEKTGEFVLSNVSDARVSVIIHEKNLGVGGAVLSGYKAALEINVDIVVKLDGDGQMDASLISDLIAPIQDGKADYSKGNRFFSWENLQQMPSLRLLGNSGLSFVSKLVTGYWSVMDPTNGFTAISATCLRHLPMDKIEHRYFFESDMLFRLGTLRANVWDMPMISKYGNELSSLSILTVLASFPLKYMTRLTKRIIYNYYLRDFNFGSMMLASAFFLLVGGFVFGSWQWSLSFDRPSTSGTVMVAALPMILGFQSLLSFLSFDILSEPKVTGYPIKRKT